MSVKRLTQQFGGAVSLDEDERESGSPGTSAVAGTAPSVRAEATESERAAKAMMLELDAAKPTAGGATPSRARKSVGVFADDASGLRSETGDGSSVGHSVLGESTGDASGEKVEQGASKLRPKSESFLSDAHEPKSTPAASVECSSAPRAQARTPALRSNSRQKVASSAAKTSASEFDFAHSELRESEPRPTEKEEGLGRKRKSAKSSSTSASEKSAGVAKPSHQHVQRSGDEQPQKIDVAGKSADVDIIERVAAFATGKTGSSRALEIAFGVPLCAALLLVIKANLSLFSSMIMGVLIAALLSVALLPLRDAVLRSLFGSDNGSADGERERDHEDSDSVAQNAEIARAIVFAAPRKFTLAVFGFVFLALLMLEPKRAGILVALLGAVLAILGLLWLVLRASVSIGALERESAAAAFSLSALMTLGGVVLGGLSIGATVDAANAAMTAGVWVRDAATDMAGGEWLETNLALAQSEALKLAENNRKLIDEYALRISDATGFNVSDTVHAVFRASSAKVINGSESPYAVLRAKAGVLWNDAKKRVPRNREDAAALFVRARDQLSGAGVNVVDYQDRALAILSSAVSVISALIGSIGELFEQFSDALSLIAALFLLLSSGASSIRYVTRLLPFPTSRFNAQIDRDVRMALTAVLWGVVRFFLLHALYVWMAFSALALEFESFAALAAGFASAVPFLPDPWLISMLFAAPQLVARKLWVLLILLPLGHRAISADADKYYESIAADMLVATAILNRDMLAACSVLGGVRFGPSGFVLGPILVTCFSVIYAVFRYLIRQQQDARMALEPREARRTSPEASDL